MERFEGAAPLPELAADPRLKLIYVGSLSRNRGCSLMLDVMEQLAAGEAVLYLGGVFAAEDLAAEVQARLTAGLADRVKLLGRVPPRDLPPLSGGGGRRLGALAAEHPVRTPDRPHQAPRGYGHGALRPRQRSAGARRARTP